MKMAQIHIHLSTSKTKLENWIWSRLQLLFYDYKTNFITLERTPLQCIMTPTADECCTEIKNWNVQLASSCALPHLHINYNFTGLPQLARLSWAFLTLDFIAFWGELSTVTNYVYAWALVELNCQESLC